MRVVAGPHSSSKICGGQSTDRCRFFLKYSARDEVTLHGKGNGGVSEAQDSVNGYEEDSPLYGFIHFRRRKVILKYVPEGTSRLLQGLYTYYCNL